jgi:hypothetical protein
MLARGESCDQGHGQLRELDQASATQAAGLRRLGSDQVNAHSFLLQSSGDGNQGAPCDAVFDTSKGSPGISGCHPSPPDWVGKPNACSLFVINFVLHCFMHTPMNTPTFKIIENHLGSAFMKQQVTVQMQQR